MFVISISYELLYFGHGRGRGFEPRAVPAVPFSDHLMRYGTKIDKTLVSDLVSVCFVL